MRERSEASVFICIVFPINDMIRLHASMLGSYNGERNSKLCLLYFANAKCPSSVIASELANVAIHSFVMTMGEKKL
jgi:hypothetical protein